jgi:hypothetical protein
MALLSTAIARGTRAAQSAATAVATGTLYYVTDEFVIERSNGATWDSYYPPNGFYNAGNSSTALTLDFLNGWRQRLTLTGSCTFTLSNPVDGMRSLFKIGTGAGSFTVTWPGTVKWSGGTAPVITATASKVDLVVLVYAADTTTYYGSFIQNY